MDDEKERSPKELRQRYARSFLKRASWFQETYGSEAYYSRPRPYPVGEDLGILAPWAGLEGDPAVLPKADIMAITWFDGEACETLLRRQHDLRETLGARCRKVTEPILHFVVDRLEGKDKEAILTDLRKHPEPPLSGGAAHIEEILRSRASMEAQAERALMDSSDSTLIEATLPTPEAVEAVDYFTRLDDEALPLLQSLTASLKRCASTDDAAKRRRLLEKEALPRGRDLEAALRGIEPPEDTRELHVNLLAQIECLGELLQGQSDPGKLPSALQARLDALEEWKVRMEEEESVLDL